MRSCRDLVVLGLLALLAPACGGGGGSGGGSGAAGGGSGDPQHYFPLELGDGWNSDLTDVTSGGLPVTVSNTTVVTGTTSLNGLGAMIVKSSNTNGSIEEYLAKDAHGVTYVGNNDLTDMLTPQIAPYPLLKFPLQAGSSFVQLNRKGLDFGEDLDGDGKNERLSIHAVVTVVGFESATSPAGTFLNCARVETSVTMTVRLTFFDLSATVTGLHTQWLAPGVGSVKEILTMSGSGSTDTQTTLLTRASTEAPNFGPITAVQAPDPNSAVLADLNADGKLDLIVTNNGSTVSSLLGDGTGSFGLAASFAAAADPRSLATGDFNGDGKVDLAVANYGGASVSILIGKGNGGFNPPSNLAVAASTNPIAVVVADFNNDGKADVAVAVDVANEVSLFLGNGDGTFGGPSNFGVGVGPRSLAVGDFNGDGAADLAVAINNGLVCVLLGNGAGSFAPGTSFPVADFPVSVAVADFNGDGKQDLIVAANTAVLKNSNVSLLLGTGTGSFGAAVPFPVEPVAGATLRSVAVGDFNGDGNPDVVVAKEGTGVPGSYANLSFLFGDGSGSFSPISHFLSGLQPLFVAVGDFNGDGKADLAAPTDLFNIIIYLQTP